MISKKNKHISEKTKEQFQSQWIILLCNNKILVVYSFFSSKIHRFFTEYLKHIIKLNSHNYPIFISYLT